MVNACLSLSVYVKTENNGFYEDDGVQPGRICRNDAAAGVTVQVEELCQEMAHPFLSGKETALGRIRFPGLRWTESLIPISGITLFLGSDRGNPE